MFPCTLRDWCESQQQERLILLKTISCGEITKDHLGNSVLLAGWVHRRRDHGDLIFVDLRDQEGIIQLVFNPDAAPEAHKVAEQLRSEWVIRVIGTVLNRPDGTENPNLLTGAVEVAAERITFRAGYHRGTEITARRVPLEDSSQPPMWLPSSLTQLPRLLPEPA